MTRRIALMLAAVAAILQSPVLLGQGQPAPQTPGVTFQVEVNYVDVDVVVTDELGQFVTGLTRDDFEVFEDGKPQKIDTFSLVEIPLEKPQQVVVAGRPIAPDAQTNRRPFDGRGLTHAGPPAARVRVPARPDGPGFQPVGDSPSPFAKSRSTIPIRASIASRAS